MLNIEDLVDAILFHQAVGDSRHRHPYDNDRAEPNYNLPIENPNGLTCKPYREVIDKYIGESLYLPSDK